MRNKLYCEIQKASLRYAYFLFFDTEPYLADQLFIRHKVRVWFGSEYKKEGSPYTAIFCHVLKKDVPVFLAALEELKKSMVLCGHPHYEEEISEWLDSMENGREIASGDKSTSGETAQEQTA